MPTCPDEIKRLIERFDQQLDQVRSPEYNETQLRIDFVNPMFTCLGWDMNNASGWAEQYRQVVHEDRVKVAGQTKAPDYSFRVGGVRKFFLEAKKPSVNIKDSPDPAYQLRRYGWSAKLAVSLLTDFEELAIYDCRLARHLDKASAARRDYIDYREYPERWDFLQATFSQDAVLRGDFDRYCQTAKGRGAEAFDEKFLEEIEEWRKGLAQNLALRNQALDEAALNFAVQRIIDRIIFLRIAEDRGTEPTGQLMGLLNGESIYARLGELFHNADARYNSGLFHFAVEKERDEAPDTFTLDLEIDDAVLKGIIRRLYYPDSPYEFTVVSADILGSVYERFLGKVITLTAGHRAKIEEKPEVRKAGGVYYTPAYIVEYIVKNTVGKLLEGKTPKEATRLKVLDPACGSGSFLIGAYQHLLDWHLAQYTSQLTGQANVPPPGLPGAPDASLAAAPGVLPAIPLPAPAAPPAAGPAAPKDPQKLTTGKSAVLRPGPGSGSGADWRLTIAERKRILLDNIHGVDLDSAAVEVTKLNLLLKCLEGETSQTLGFQQRLFRERALPDLGHNILCGNSLIGTDIMMTNAWRDMSEEEKRRINPFDYERAFEKVFKQGGFDAVIGNPPWGQKAITRDSLQENYIRDHFPSAKGIFDLFRPFVELAVKITCPGCWLGQVLPDIILLKNYESTRRLLLDRTALQQIDWWGMAFADAVIDAATIIARREKAAIHHCVHVSIHERKAEKMTELLQSDFANNPRSTFNLTLTDERRTFVQKLHRFRRLADVFEIHEGVHSGNIRAELFVDNAIDASCRELLFGRDEIGPYRLQWKGRYIRLDAMPKRRSTVRYANIGQASWHENPKLLVRRTGDYVLAAVDAVGRYCSNNFFLAFPKEHPVLDLYGLCALLNSRAITAYFRIIEPRGGRVFSELKIKHLGQFPLPHAEDSKILISLNRLGHDRSQIAIEAQTATLPTDVDRAKREAEHLESEINEIVSKAFRLSIADWKLLNNALEI